MKQLALAISIVAKAFEKKLDKGGQPYILHCLRVMNGVNQKDEDLMITSVLHDLVEDCKKDGYTFEFLTAQGFSERVVGNLYLLTHNKETPYQEYIKALSVSKDCVEVKLADLEDNSKITRLKGLSKKDHDRMEKYHWAFTYLS